MVAGVGSCPHHDMLRDAIQAIQTRCTCYNPLAIQLFVQRLCDLNPIFLAAGNFALPAWEGRLLSLMSHLENRRTNRDINAVVNWWNDYQPTYLFNKYSRGSPLPLTECAFRVPILHGRTGKEETYVWLRQILSHLSNECSVPEYKNQWFDVLRSHYNRTRQHDLDLINTLMIQLAEEGLLRFH
ncbi:hypothetical protein K443DRAFT_502092 [Laccaria amethystina LaAM-08-1]|uniref:Uncharacterized protein n=1 Tax=Laccaria amethystina LaAM-08-1 TaxID=1095629 RepID=A0A0C9WUN2_9AGAR|nr:hypothetical protein K443DRAFT_502092 [Laccaria amethystina LaAM-08-1]